MKGDPSILTIMRAKNSFFEIKDFSSVECYKEINDTSFSYGFIVFSS